MDLVRKLRLTQGMDIKEEDEYEENEGKDEIRNKILRIMGQVSIFSDEMLFHSNNIKV